MPAHAFFRDRIKSLRRVPAGKLRENPKNWRKHPDGQFNALRAIMEEVGFAGALLAYEEGKELVIIDGHLRAEIAEDEKVPVLVTDLSPEEADKVLLTFDPIGGMAEEDEEALKELMAGIDFESGELKEMFLDIEASAPKDGLTDPNDVPETPEEPRTKPGDLWILGNHRLLCGDSLDAQDVGRLMDGKRAVLFATDPPYLVDYDGTNHPSSGNKNWSETYGITWDDSSQGPEFYENFVSVAVEHAIRKNAAWYCWHASRRQAMVEKVWEKFGAFVHQQIVWVKNRPVLTRCWYMGAHEPCFFGWIRGKKPPRRSTDHPTTVWDVKGLDGDERPEHPTPKPVELFEIPIIQHTRKGDICFEPFSGSGTQIIAAERLGRSCFAMEIEPRYVDVAVRRWEKFTGEKAGR